MRQAYRLCVSWVRDLGSAELTVGQGRPGGDMKGTLAHTLLSVSQAHRKALWRGSGVWKGTGVGPLPRAHMYARTYLPWGKVPHITGGCGCTHTCRLCVCGSSCVHSCTDTPPFLPPEASRIFLGHKSQAVSILFKKISKCAPHPSIP